MLVTQSCLILCNPMECSPPDWSVHGISQARILEQVVISSSRGSSLPRDRTRISCVSCVGRWILTTEPPGKPYKRELSAPMPAALRLEALAVLVARISSCFLLVALWLYILHKGQSVSQFSRSVVSDSSHKGMWFIFSQVFHFLHLVVKLIQYHLLKGYTSLNCLCILAKAQLN